MRRSATAVLLVLAALAFGGTPGWGAPPPPPATVNATGTSITLDEGAYPGLTFESTAPVRLMLTSQTGFVTMSVQPDVPPIGVVDITLRGLPAGSYWYLYNGQLVDPLTFTADAEGVVTFPLDLSEDRYLSLMSTRSTYVIRNNATGGDCTKIGTWNLASRTCTLDRDVDQSIALSYNYLTLDGAGHTLRGPGYGVYAENMPGLRIRNLVLDGGSSGISLNRSAGSVVENCTIRNAATGITLFNGGPYDIRNTRIENAGNCIDVRFAGGTFTGLDLGPAGGAGLYTWYSGGAITNSVIHDCSTAIVAPGWTAYNNIFRDCGTEIVGAGRMTLNRSSPSTGPNIIGGPFIGGNYYTKSDGTGFSDTAFDVAPHDGFADQPYAFGADIVDNLPLVIYRSYVNYPPVLSPVGDQTVPEGQTLSFTLAATDQNPGETLSFSAANLPPGTTFDPVTAAFTWTPGYDQAGTYGGIEFTVTDDGVPFELDVEIISISVGNTNRPPVFDPVGPLAVAEYSTFAFVVSATDPDADAIGIHAGAMPRGAAFDPATRVFTWRPDGTQAGVYPIYFFAVDNGVPPLTSELGVIVTVGQVTSPIDLVRMLIAEILDQNHSEPVVNSYLANLKKVEIFIAEGKLGPAINQVEAFILKCTQDIEHEIIPRADGEYLLMMATDFLALLRG